jgi:hypothetical protein
MASEIQRDLLRFALRGWWRKDLPVLLWGVVLAFLLAIPVMVGWLLPGVGGGLLCLVTLFVLASLLRRRWHAQAAAGTAVIGLYSSDRRVRLEFLDDGVRMETEMLRGEAAWTELDELVEFPTFWSLSFSNGGHIAIPTALLSADLRSYLENKAHEASAPLLRA